MGQGIAILPKDDVLYAPISGEVTCMYKSKHAIGITSKHGVEVLLHIGIDTVRLDGLYFENFVNQGDNVNTGDKLVQFNRTKIQEEGYDITVMVIITNSSSYQEIKQVKLGEVHVKEHVLSIR